MLQAGAVPEGGGGAQAPPVQRLPAAAPAGPSGELRLSLARARRGRERAWGVCVLGGLGNGRWTIHWGCVEPALPSKRRHRWVSEATESQLRSAWSLLLGRWENVGRGRGGEKLVTGRQITIKLQSGAVSTRLPFGWAG